MRRKQTLSLPEKPNRSNRCDFCINQSFINIYLGGIRSLILCKDCYKFVKSKPRFNPKKYKTEVKKYLKLKKRIKQDMAKLRGYKQEL